MGFNSAFKGLNEAPRFFLWVKAREASICHSFTIYDELSKAFIIASPFLSCAYDQI
jgi:hypothetical protein